MRRTLIALLLLAAGCKTPGPRDELILLSDAQERAGRDVLALRFSESEDGTLVSVVVPRSGDADCRWELGTREKTGFINSLVQQGHVARRERRVVPVTSEQRDDVVARFAALPPGASEWTLPLPIPEGHRAGPGFDGETEISRPDPVTLRMVLVSRTGDLQTVIVYEGNPKGASASAKAGGEAVSALEKSFQAIVLPPSGQK